MLGIVTSFFNPCGYKRIEKNYFQFRDAIGHPVHTVELSFNGKFIIPDAIHLHGGDEHIMFQKERMLNLAIESLDEKYDKIAWIDADLIFLNSNWYKETEKLLENFPLIQLFEHLHLLNSKGEISRTIFGYVKAMQSRSPSSGTRAPGGAWAARREVLVDGLNDYDVTGGGDTVAVDCWLGRWDSWMLMRCSPKWKEANLQWGKKQFQKIGGNLGHISGDIAHLYHGSDKNRQYGRRSEYLINNDFDPTKDIAIDDNGLWKWSSHKPEMHRQIANYFAQRREDDQG